jgi:hypothetical protein
MARRVEASGLKMARDCRVYGHATRLTFESASKKDFAAGDSQFNVTVVQRSPSRVAVAHDLSDMGHHERLRRIAVEGASRRESTPSNRISAHGVIGVAVRLLLSNSNRSEVLPTAHSETQV